MENWKVYAQSKGGSSYPPQSVVALGIKGPEKSELKFPQPNV